MIQGHATLIVDLGNSSTKATVLFGKDSQTGKYRARSFEVPNSSPSLMRRTRFRQITVMPHPPFCVLIQC